MLLSHWKILLRYDGQGDWPNVDSDPNDAAWEAWGQGPSESQGLAGGFSKLIQIQFLHQCWLCDLSAKFP